MDISHSTTWPVLKDFAIKAWLNQKIKKNIQIQAEKIKEQKNHTEHFITLPSSTLYVNKIQNGAQMW